MRRFGIPVAVALVAATAFPAGSPAGDKKEGADGPANLLTNGGFEDGPDLGEAEFKPVDKDSEAIKGWVVTRGQIDYIGGHWQAAGGKRSLDLNGSPGVGGVKQTFPTTKGQTYRVTFRLAGNPGGEPRKKAVRVEAAGGGKEFGFDTAGRTVWDMGWEEKAWEFVAAADTTTLEIYSLTTEGESFGPALDEVAVRAAK
jgi:choice-of-anchor C domain-containing protein